MTTTTTTRKTSDMNTPNDPLANDDQHGQSVYTSMDNMSTRLSHYQIPRYEPRNYRKLLKESNVPAAWYQTAPPPCSIYFYDPQFQKYLHKRVTPSNSPRKPCIDVTPRLVDQSFESRSSPRKNFINSSTTSFFSPKRNYSSKNSNEVPSRLKPVPTFPPIDSSKKLMK